jgi:hypothetical protein
MNTNKTELNGAETSPTLLTSLEQLNNRIVELNELKLFSLNILNKLKQPYPTPDVDKETKYDNKGHEHDETLVGLYQDAIFNISNIINNFKTNLYAIDSIIG